MTFSDHHLQSIPGVKIILVPIESRQFTVGSLQSRPVTHKDVTCTPTHPPTHILHSLESEKRAVAQETWGSFHNG